MKVQTLDSRESGPPSMAVLILSGAFITSSSRRAHQSPSAMSNFVEMLSVHPLSFISTRMTSVRPKRSHMADMNPSLMRGRAPLPPVGRPVLHVDEAAQVLTVLCEALHEGSVAVATCEGVAHIEVHGPVRPRKVDFVSPQAVYNSFRMTKNRQLTPDLNLRPTGYESAILAYA